MHHAPISKRYYSHRLAHRAVLAPAPKLLKPEFLPSGALSSSPCFSSSANSTPQLRRKELNGAEPPLSPCESEASSEMPKRHPDGVKRVPLVVIPRRKKHKNYVSRRRNTQMVANLRRCSSDPVIYKSFNSWTGLSKAFGDEEKQRPVQQSTQLADAVRNGGGRQFPVAEQAPSAPSAASKLSQRKFPIGGTTAPKNAFGPTQPSRVAVPAKANNGAVSAARNALGFDKKPDVEKKPDEKASAPSGPVRRLSRKMAAPSVDATCAPSTSSIPTSPLPPPSPSAKIPPAADPKASPIEKKITARRKKVDELAQIKKELREGPKIPPLSSVIRKQSGENSDEAKAKNTVDAITAAFAKVNTSEAVQSPTQVRKMSGQKELVQPGAPAKNATAAKPPASPSMGVRREPQKLPKIGDSASGHKLPTNLKNVAPTTIPTTPESLRKPLEIQAECSKASDASEDFDKSIEPPVLNLSRQVAVPTPSVVGSRKPSKPLAPNSAALLASLQLPPSVSAKVDKIIATGGKPAAKVSMDHIISGIRRSHAKSIINRQQFTQKFF